MTMRTASTTKTPCEIIRCINDLCQEDNPKDNEIRKLCAEAERGAKKIAQALSKANHKFLLQPGLWEQNPGWKKLLANRLRDDYLQEGSKTKIGKL